MLCCKVKAEARQLSRTLRDNVPVLPHPAPMSSMVLFKTIRITVKTVSYLKSHSVAFVMTCHVQLLTGS